MRLLLIALLVCLANAAAHAGWKAGVAKGVITPEKNMWMAGYGARSAPSDGVTTDLYAKALVLDSGDGARVVLVSLDLVGIDRDVASLICEELEAKHGLKREQIALCTSHTHSGPVMGRVLRPMYFLDDEQQRLVNEYTRTFRRKVVAVVGEALADLRDADVAYGNGLATFAVNRRNNKEPEVPQLRAEGKLKGPVDHEVPVLSVKDKSGRLIAVAFGYACHATVLSFSKFNADYPGYAMTAIEQANPGATALFFAGCGADQNPLPRRTVELAEKYGSELAAAVQQVLGSAMKPVSPRLATRFTETQLPLRDPPTREQVEKDAQSANKFIVSRAKMFLRQLDQGRDLPRSYPYPVQVWKVGDELRWVFLGGEVVVDYSLRLKQELGQGKTWVAGYSNDVMAYIASKRVLQEGGYEGGLAMTYYGLPAPWAEESEQVIVDTVDKLAK